MSIDSIDTLLAVLVRAQILSPEQADEVWRELAPLYQSADELGARLVKIDWLTSYQLQLLLVGQWDELVIGPYQVLDLLGEGGVSEVFKAWDTQRGRVVALKVLRQHLAGKSDALRAFQREMRILAQLSHPNIIKMVDAHADGLLHYFAMEYVEGMDLGRFVQQVGPLPVEAACDYTRQAAQGLQHAHQMGLVHRDIKPANLFLQHAPLPSCCAARRPDPVVKILDWGLARRIQDPADPAPCDPDDPSGDVEKGSIIGTADFIAPEQARDPTLVDIRADIYSLGCTLYFLLTGQPPFPGMSVMQKILAHQQSQPPSVLHVRPDVPRELDALIHKMLAKDPRDRFAIPLLVVTALRRFMMTAKAAGPAAASRAETSTLHRTPAPGTALNLPRPGTQSGLARPGTHVNLPQPGAAGGKVTR
jgi:serine/threonine-protein kinase